MDKSHTYLCVCGIAYAQRQSLYRHRKTCDIYNNKECESQKDVCSDNLNQDQLILLQADNTRLHELLRAQQEQIQKLDNKIQMQKQVAELQERERNMLIEQIKLSQHRENMFIEQIKTLQDRENMYIEQLKTLQDRENMFIEQIKTLQFQFTNKVETVKIVEPPKVEQPKLPNKVEVTNKKPSVKSYLSTCNPVTFTTFMDKHITTIQDYSNVICYGIEEGIVKNIINHLSTYEKENYPIIITNQQATRMKMLVYDTKDDTNQWIKYKAYKAREFLEDMANRYSNKLYRHVSTVFKSHYPGMDDRDHPDHKNHSEQRHALYGQLRHAESCSRKIANRIVEHYIISNEDDDDSETED